MPLGAAAAVLLAACGAAVALAQTDPAGIDALDSATTVERQSLARFILDALEWPGYLLIAASVLLIALIVEHFIFVRRATIVPEDETRDARRMIEQRKFRLCLDRANKSATFFGQTLAAALKRSRHGFAAMQVAARDRAEEQAAAMHRRVEYLNLLGNLGPLMGLLGTVYGMIISFRELGDSAGGGELARGISLALVNTLLGLVVAIVGIGCYGWCRNRVDHLTVSATVAVLDLLEYFRPAGGAAPRATNRAAESQSPSAPPQSASTPQPARPPTAPAAPTSPSSPSAERKSEPPAERQPEPPADSLGDIPLSSGLEFPKQP